MKVYFTLIGVIISLGGFAQTGIGTTTPNASAKLDVSSSTMGFLPPRVALTASNVFAPIAGTSSAAAGLLIYNTATAGTIPNNVVPGYYYWNGTKWYNWSNPCLNMETIEFTDFSLSATSFTLLHTPRDISAVYMYINGVRITNAAYIIDPTNNTKITYDPTNRHAIVSGDRVQFDYQYCQ